MSGFAAFAVAGLIRAVRKASGDLSRVKVPADYPHEEVHTLMADTLDRMLLGCIGEGPLRAPSSCITVVEPPAGHRTEELMLPHLSRARDHFDRFLTAREVFVRIENLMSVSLRGNHQLGRQAVAGRPRHSKETP